MIRTILGLAAGFFIAGWVVDSESAKKFREVAAEKASGLKGAVCENAAKATSAAQKAAAAVKEEFSKKKEGEEENA
jgi:hypothetical protein